MKQSLIVKTVAKNLKKIRLSKHLTQAELAKKAGITSNHYARIERGESIPTVTTLAALAKSLKAHSSKILPF